MSKMKMVVEGWCRGCRCVRETMLVQSRAGGFITRDCLTCGTSNSVGKKHLPTHLRCRACSTQSRPVRLTPGQNRVANYTLDCAECGGSWELWQFLPYWNEAFRWSGYRIDADEPPEHGWR